MSAASITVRTRRELGRHAELLLLVPLLLVIVPFLLTPILLGFIASFTNLGIPPLNVQFTGLQNYAAVLADREFDTSWLNIVVFVLVAVPCELAIGLGLAYLLREPFRGRGLVRVVLLTPWLVSPIASGVMWHFLFSLQVGLINYLPAWLGITVPSPFVSLAWALPTTIATVVWHNAPLAGFLLLPGLLAIRREYWEDATIEGANFFARIAFIAVPLMQPLLLAVGLLLVGDTLGTSESILLLTGGGPGTATSTPGLYSYLQAFKYSFWSTGGTAAWLIVLGMLLVGIVYLRLARAEAQ